MTLLIKVSAMQWVFEKTHVENAFVGWSIAILLIKLLAWGGDSQFSRFENKDTKYRSSHRLWSVRKGILRNFAKFTGKHLYQSLRPANLLKKRLWHRCFSVNFAKLLRTYFLQNSSGRMLLYLLYQCSYSWKLRYV